MKGIPGRYSYKQHEGILDLERMLSTVWNRFPYFTESKVWQGQVSYPNSDNQQEAWPELTPWQTHSSSMPPQCPLVLSHLNHHHIHTVCLYSWPLKNTTAGAPKPSTVENPRITWLPKNFPDSLLLTGPQ